MSVKWAKPGRDDRERASPIGEKVEKEERLHSRSQKKPPRGTLDDGRNERTIFSTVHIPS